jgi:NADH-quinone oxidoreductase subunit I
MGYIVKRDEIGGAAYKVYFLEVARGMYTVMRHLVRNFSAYWLGVKGPVKSLAPNYDIRTIDYPEERAALPPRYRARHRLLPREDGTPRCVACKCCESTCPAKCIRIVEGEHEDPAIEKRPVIFEIDELRCVFCGYCVEACPCDAIRMDSEIVELAEYDRASFVLGINQLLLDIPNKPSVKGGLW